jgi:flagellar hook-basal body complex protein FliE
MTIPPVAGVGGGLSIGQLEGLGPEGAPAAGEGPGSGSSGEGISLEAAASGEGSAPTSPVGPAEGATQAGQAGGGEGGGGEPGGFGGALTEAISSLEKSQSNATTASQQLAAGTVKDPESAVVTVEDGVLAMQLAAQIRSKATEAVQTIFQTQA